MMRDKIRLSILESIREKFGDSDAPEFSVVPPENPEHGDYATNAAMVLAKALKKNPMAIAEELVQEVRGKNQEAGKIEIAKPGFINFWLPASALHDEFTQILIAKELYGRGEKKNRSVQVEFISANPTGPLTMANGRGGFFGDALSRVLAHQGYTVEREYYINDAGNQIKTLGLSVLAASGLAADDENFYHGDYIGAWAKENPDLLRVNNNEASYESLGRQLAQYIRDTMIKPSIDRMGIRFDRWTSEHADIRMKKYIEKFIDFSGKKDPDLIYMKDGAQWLKTTAYGDDKDRVLVTSDRLPTYFLVDAGHYLETRERGFEEKINIVGADHHGYVGRIQAVAKIVGLAKSEVIVMQLVRLMEDGREVRMSKRKGVFVTMDELIDEVGVDAARYFFLERSPDTHMTFDVGLAKERSAKNPVYYVQYAHARIAAILRKISHAQDSRAPQRNLLQEVEETSLLKKLIQFSEIVEDTARDYHVHRLPQYAWEVAHLFHHFYEQHRVITDDLALTEARLALIRATQITLKNTLGLMGIDAPEEM